MKNGSRSFAGWRITAAAFVTLGLTVGIPNYNLPFFYDYFQREHGWSRAAITLGFPLATILTIWVGPVVIHRISARKLILAGSTLGALSFVGFAAMGSSLRIYYLVWIVYTLGYILGGPIPHQLIISHWFRRNRGKAMGIIYAGLGLMGSLGSLAVKPLTGNFGFREALVIVGLSILICWPVAIFIFRDTPEEMGQNPDGDAQPPAESAGRPLAFIELLRSNSFWLLLVGSSLVIGAVNSISYHLKFLFLDAGFAQGSAADAAWRSASVLILWSSIVGRLLAGALSDIFPKKIVMAATFALVGATVPVLLMVNPARQGSLYVFAVFFGFALGGDYMLIPLMAAEQFGVNSLARAMAIIFPVNTIGQTWVPYFVSLLRDRLGNYSVAMNLVLVIAAAGAIAVAILPPKEKERQKWPEKPSA